jgi:hypothetical protein
MSSPHASPSYIARRRRHQGATLYAKTVSEPVDKHVARFVDAINRSRFHATTLFSCSGHVGKDSFPYVAFACRGFSFVLFMLQCVSRVNVITGGGTQLRLMKLRGGRVYGAIGFVSYPSRYGTDWAAPPAHLVHLWWAELDELGSMLETERAEVSAGFRDVVSKRRWLTHRGTLS